MMWLANSSFASYSQVAVNTIPRLRMVARKRPTSVLTIVNSQGKY